MRRKHWSGRYAKTVGMWLYEPPDVKILVKTTFGNTHDFDAGSIHIPDEEEVEERGMFVITAQMGSRFASIAYGRDRWFRLGRRFREEFTDFMGAVEWVENKTTLYLNRIRRRA